MNQRWHCISETCSLSTWPRSLTGSIVAHNRRSHASMQGQLTKCCRVPLRGHEKNCWQIPGLSMGERGMYTSLYLCGAGFHYASSASAPLPIPFPLPQRMLSILMHKSTHPLTVI
jgi:hypothetical protein